MIEQAEKEVKPIKTYTWTYEVSWQPLKSDVVQTISKIMSEEERENIAQDILKVSKTQAFWLEVFQVDTKLIRVILKSTQQINLNKIARNIQKIMIKRSELDLTKWQCLMLTKSKEEASQDVKIQKLLDDLWSGAYYDLKEGLEEEELEKLKYYLGQRKLGVIEQDEQVFLIDLQGLKEEINLNCFECTKKYQYGCCCGTPCGFSDKNMSLFDKHMLKIEEALKAVDSEQYEKLQKNGGFMTANGKLKAFDGHCALLIKEEGVYKCMAHKYALEQSIPSYDLCPLSCLMYPLEVIELVTNKGKKVYLLTSVVDETFAKEFGRWGSYESLKVELKCIHKTEHDNIFKVEDYYPVYEVNKDLIIHEFGDDIYRAIHKLYE